MSKSFRKIVDTKKLAVKYLTVESAIIISDGHDPKYGAVVEVSKKTENPSILIVCEHAANDIPPHLNNLGLAPDARVSHAAWDPGALAVAAYMADRLPAMLISGRVSRLVYDCNRPPDAPSAIPEKSEIYDIPGNVNLTAAERQNRIDSVYRPFEAALRNHIKMYRKTLSLMVTIHSFTPVFHGKKRGVEIGILHGQDTRFAYSMMGAIPPGSGWNVRLNEPYSAQDGVAHTLDLHGAGNGLANVMIEIRNDFIQTSDTQQDVARFLSDWLIQTLGGEP